VRHINKHGRLHQSPPLETVGKQPYLAGMSESTQSTADSGFSITQAAATQIARIIENEGGGAAACLRVAVQGGGCSGFSYVFSIDDNRAEDDHAFARDGVTVLVDDMSLAYMTGSEIDWVDDMIGAAFQIKNPNATAACGCGTSFDI